MNAHDEMIGNAPAYVLGSLDPDERRAFDAHLASCAECEQEVRALRRVVTALALGVPQRTPRAELRDRVLGAVGATDARRSTGRVVKMPSRLPSWLPLAATLAIAVALGAYAARLNTRIATLEARLTDAARESDRFARVAAEAQSAMAVLGAPDLARIDLAGQPAAPQAHARALWSRAHGMVFTATNLPPLPAGKVYQVWVVTAAAPMSAGLLAPDASGRGTAYFTTPSDIPAPLAVAVTVEPAGGMPAPTGEKFLVGTPSSTL